MKKRNLSQKCIPILLNHEDFVELVGAYIDREPVTSAVVYIAVQSNVARDVSVLLLPYCSK